MNDLAPIVLFVYNRPEHTLSVLNSLKENFLASESTLYIFADGPKTNCSKTDLEKIKETRVVIRSNKWCKEVNIIESNQNKGLAVSVVQGVSQIIEKHGKIIILEDDLILSKHFLEYMNKGLNIYQDVDNVYSINGFMFPIDFKENTTFLLPYTSSWGWATWKRQWRCYKNVINEDDKKIIINNKFIRQRFNLANYNYTSMLELINNSWAIKWHYSVFLRNGLGVFPSHSLIANEGFDGTGTNCIDSDFTTNFGTDNNIRINKDLDIKLNFYDQYLSYFATEDKNKSLKNLLKKILTRF